VGKPTLTVVSGTPEPDPDAERRRRHAANQRRYYERHSERREQQRRDRAVHPDQVRERRAEHQRVWRAAHPVEVALQRKRYRQRRYYREHPDRVLPRAYEIVGIRRSTLIYLYDPLYDDLIQVAAMALVEGRDAQQAVKEYRSTEVSWGSQDQAADRRHRGLRP
jgi:hypothetical protein